ncbi:unnamed protein product [Pedinophyceae sp. YPF-701]|nr:unnamed protein product [Pedinophyceae sp. YPF-701]
MDKATGEPTTDPKRRMKYADTIAKTTASMGATLVSYDPQEGVWVFRTEHFSRYGVADDSDDEDEDAERAGAEQDGRGAANGVERPGGGADLRAGVVAGNEAAAAAAWEHDDDAMEASLAGGDSVAGSEGEWGADRAVAGGRGGALFREGGVAVPAAAAPPAAPGGCSWITPRGDAMRAVRPSRGPPSSSPVALAPGSRQGRDAAPAALPETIGPSAMVDAGAFMGRSTRVGWAAGSRLAFAGGLTCGYAGVGPASAREQRGGTRVSCVTAASAFADQGVEAAQARVVAQLRAHRRFVAVDGGVAPAAAAVGARRRPADARATRPLRPPARRARGPGPGRDPPGGPPRLSPRRRRRRRRRRGRGRRRRDGGPRREPPAAARPRPRGVAPRGPEGPGAVGAGAGVGAGGGAVRGGGGRGRGGGRRRGRGRGVPVPAAVGGRVAPGARGGAAVPGVRAGRARRLPPDAGGLAEDPEPRVPAAVRAAARGGRGRRGRRGRPAPGRAGGGRGRARRAARDVGAQLDAWAAERPHGILDGRQPESRARRRVYTLVSGRVSEALRRFKEEDPGPDLPPLDWRRALGLHFWYGAGPAAALGDAIQAYEADVVGGVAPRPVPLYRERDALFYGDDSAVRRMENATTYELLRLRTGQGVAGALASGGASFWAKLLRPQGHTPDALDLSCAWLLASVLGAIGRIGSGAESPPEALWAATGLVDQLCADARTSHWALYVAAQLPDDHAASPGLRARFVEDVVLRFAPCWEEGGEAEALALDVLGPAGGAALLAYARAVHMGVEGACGSDDDDAERRVRLLLRAGRAGEALEELLGGAAPPAAVWLLGGDHARLRQVLEELPEGAGDARWQRLVGTLGAYCRLAAASMQAGGLRRAAEGREGEAREVLARLLSGLAEGGGGASATRRAMLAAMARSAAQWAQDLAQDAEPVRASAEAYGDVLGLGGCLAQDTAADQVCCAAARLLEAIAAT